MIVTLPTSDHCVYVARDHDLQVLYVGVTSHLFMRLGQHQINSGWWPRVKIIDVECFPTRGEANDRETFLIRSLTPPGNDRGNPLALMGVEGVSIAEVRAFLASRQERLPVDPSLASLREYADEAGLGLKTLNRWRERRSDFPVEVSIGARGTKLYDRDHLRAYVRDRQRENA